MEKNQRKYAVSVSFTAFLLFAVGCWAGLFIVMPQLVKFLLSFATQSVVPMITIGKYVSFATFITVACGIIFETPLIIVILAKIGIIKPAALARRRREVIVAAFIIAAVITPTTDVVTQTVLAVILWLLYEVGIGVAKIVAKEKPVKIFNNESH
jgi:sec-independent protein translocase protein TatC